VVLLLSDLEQRVQFSSTSSKLCLSHVCYWLPLLLLFQLRLLLLLLLHVLMLLLPLSLQGGFRYRRRTVALDLSGALGGMNSQSFAVLKHAVLRLSKGSRQARQHDSSSVIMQLLLQDSQPHHNKQCYLWCMQPHNILSSCAGVQGSASHKMQQM